MDTLKGNEEVYDVQSIKHIRKDMVKTPHMINASILLSLDLKDTWSQIICENLTLREQTGRKLELINALQICARKVGVH